ncbi:MAG: CHASE2 domain-containing protein [Planctomycetes bacterium]|nr:CHASE2 domain-containing protein [Planctomycetota bacterium]
MDLSEWMRRRFWAFLLGATVTGMAVIAYLGGWFNPLARFHLDESFRHLNQIQPDPRIVLVDINDYALRSIHRWPWPRRMQADLVGVLAECGAEAILLDIVYAEPTPGRISDPRLEPDYELKSEHVEVLGKASIDNAIFDDRELANAIRNAGNVYVALFFELSPPSFDPQQLRDDARKILDEDPTVGVEAFGERLNLPTGEDTSTRYVQARIDHLLRNEFGLDQKQIAERLNLPEDTVEIHLSRIKSIAAQFLVRAVLADNPDATIAEVHHAVLPDQPIDVETRDHSDVFRATTREFARKVVRSQSLDNDPAYAHLLPNGIDPTMPIHSIASAAKRIGFVNFNKDSDGVLRHVPVLARVDGKLVEQIGFALAADVLDIDLDAIETDGINRLTLTDKSRTHRWTLPLNANGEMLINWHVDHASPSWENSFEHIPVSRAMEVALSRRAIKENLARLRLRLFDAVELMYEGAQAGLLDHEERIRKLNSLEAEIDRVAAEQRESLRTQANVLLKDIEYTERLALSNLQRMHEEIKTLEPEDDEEKAFFARIQNLHRQLVQGEIQKGIERSNAQLQARADELLVELRAKLKGKLCFVGHTASAQADMVNSPVFENMPGVMAHANLVNTLLQNRLPTVTSDRMNVLLILITGAIITFLTATKGPWFAFGSLLLLIIPTLGVSSLLMWKYGHFVATLILVAATFVTWALITLYRQSTEERQRRSFARALARNTSPAIAASITRHMDKLDLSPKPAEVTCYFSDLQGFTSISERLDADQTKTILNRYLGAMGEVLIKYRAFNKFMGDGIFAFFNSPLWPVEDHVVTGCEAALETAATLVELKKSTELDHTGEFQKLWMRVGVHTGPVYVGYFGSENQTDYTCIGDTVNLAARLEGANKAFGTQIMISDACRVVAGDRYHYRHLAALQVKGKAQAVQVYELLGRKGMVDSDTLEYASTFDQAVTHFQNRDWTESKRLFQCCKARRPDDAAIELYDHEIERLLVSPPPEGQDWNMAIELTSK